MTRQEFRENYHKVDTYLQDLGCVEMEWRLHEHNEFGEDVQMIATNGPKYVYTWESLEYTVNHLDEYEVHEFEED